MSRGQLMPVANLCRVAVVQYSSALLAVGASNISRQDRYCVHLESLILFFNYITSITLVQTHLYSYMAPMCLLNGKYMLVIYVNGLTNSICYILCLCLQLGRKTRMRDSILRQ